MLLLSIFVSEQINGAAARSSSTTQSVHILWVFIYESHLEPITPTHFLCCLILWNLFGIESFLIALHLVQMAQTEGKRS